MAQSIKIGDIIPDFTAHDHEGMEIEAEDLIGSPFVLYFYPKDDTPGCTKEACSFRDNMDALNDLETLVIGVSPDNAISHNKFIEKHDLNFTLLCDENLSLARKFNVLKDNQSIIRSTFVVDASGIIRWIEQPVNVEGHAQRVLQAVQQIAQETAS